jgi:MFS family permease
LKQGLCDGLSNEVITAVTTGAVLSAWAVYLHAGALLIGALTAFPLLAQVLQLPAAQWIDRWGRRRVAIVGYFIRGQAYLPLIFVPWLNVALPTQRLLLVSSALVAAVATVLANTAWAAWMGEVLPNRVRGRFYGLRYSLAMLGSGTATLGAGLLLDGGSHAGSLGPALSCISLVICIAACVTTWSLSRQTDVAPHAAAAAASFSWRALVAPLKNPAARRYVSFQALWNAAVASSGGFVAIHYAVNLGLSFKVIAAQALVAAFCRVATSAFWGRMVDRFGSRPVLIASGAGICVLPVVQGLATPSAPWPIWLDATISGIAWAANANAIFCLPYRLAPAKQRTSYLALFTAIGGLCNGLTAIIAGAVADLLPQRVELGGFSLFDIQVLFAVGFVLRCAALLYGLRIVEHGSVGTRAMLVRLRADVVTSAVAASRPLARALLLRG